MNDTPIIIEQRYHAMVMELTPAERLKMCCRMFRTAKRLLLAGIHMKYGSNADPKTINRETFLRLYGDDFPEPHIKVILKLLQ
jgi:hypothetical protein